MADQIPTPTNTAWSLKDLKGTAADLIEEVQAAAFVPEKAKADILDVLGKADPAVKLWRVDAHFQSFSDQRGPYYSSGFTIRAL
jgi:hypothetical protein